MNEIIQKATHSGSIKIGEIDIPCYVLEDGTRVLSQTGLQNSVGFSKGGGHKVGVPRIGTFLSKISEKGIDVSNLMAGIQKPTEFRPTHGGRTAYGYEATILADMCDAVFEANKHGFIIPQQNHIAVKCEILMRGFAKVGIIALVDEATGYQEIRDRLALQKILDKYITDEWAKWTKTFPDEYYRELFKLHKMPYPPQSSKRPSYIGHWTNDIVYSRLAPGVLKKLKEVNPRQPSGSRKRKFFQHLTKDWGTDELREHLSNIIFLMKSCTTWADFKRRLNRAKPKYGDTMPLDFPESEN